MKFKQEQILNQIPYPQLDDPTNCVIYTYMNLLLNKSFLKFKKYTEGHNEQEETKILNQFKHLWIKEDYQLFPNKITSNGRHLYNGLTIGQLQWALDYVTISIV